MRKHTKKTYYSAGLISIVLLPIMCILYLQSIKAFTEYNAMDVWMWDGKLDSSLDSALVKHVNSKIYTVVNLTGNNASDEKKLVHAQKKVKRITASNDSINGIKFHFGKKSEYWTYVRVIDIMVMEKAKFYVNYKNDIWFANPKLEKAAKYVTPIQTLGCSYFTTNYIKRDTIPSIETNETLEKYALPILAYFLIVAFTSIRIYKLYRK